MVLASIRDVITSRRVLCLSTFAAVACGGVTAASLAPGDAGVDATQLGGSLDGSANDAVSVGDGGTADAQDETVRDAAIDNDPQCPSAYGATGACSKERLE